MNGVFQSLAVLASLLAGIVSLVALLFGVDAIPALAASVALFIFVATWGGTR
jgi:Na+(H+)/acetate symporter ActP